MKLAKRILTAGVALALTLGLNIPAFAATITVENAVDGETYTAYKLFDVTHGAGADGVLNNDDDTYAYYTSSETLKNALEGANAGLTFTQAEGTGNWYVSGGVNAATLAEYINTHWDDTFKNLLTAAGTGEASNKTASIDTNGQTGYFFVDSSLGSLCILKTADANVTVEEKNSLPSISKTVLEDSTSAWGETATIDGEVDTIYYKLTVNTGTGYAGLGNGVDSDYTITDVLPAGIAYNENSIKLPDGWTVYNEETKSGDYTVSYAADTHTLTIILKASKLAGLGQNKNIEITYDADAKDVAGNLTVGTTGHTNTVTLSYKNHNFTDNAVVKTYDLGTTTDGTPTITKVDGSETPVKLQGVKFVLSKTVTVPAEGEGEPTTTTVFATFDQSNYLTGWVDSQDDATELVTDSNGNIKAYGLDADTYILTETETLPGYNLLDDTITVVIDESGNETYKLTSSTDAPKDTITVVNEAGSQLPSTGGMGTTILYIAGAALVLGAGVTLVVRRRMNSDR